MGWRETWRETVESFLRELHGPDGGAESGADAVAEAISAARAEMAALERELERVDHRMGVEEGGAATCRRRREQAERIGDPETAALAGRFEQRHTERAAVLRRKREVLRDEWGLARAGLNELLDLVRDDAAQRPGP